MVATRLYATDSQFSTLLYSSEASVRLYTMTAATAQSDCSLLLMARLVEAKPPPLVDLCIRLARYSPFWSVLRSQL